jgi:hypothetical protein
MLLKNIIIQKITYTISREQKKNYSSKIVPTHSWYLLGSDGGKNVEWGPLVCNVSHFGGIFVLMLDSCLSYSSALKMEAICTSKMSCCLSTSVQLHGWTYSSIIIFYFGLRVMHTVSDWYFKQCPSSNCYLKRHFGDLAASFYRYNNLTWWRRQSRLRNVTLNKN